MALAREGVNLTINARTEKLLKETAAEIRDETGVQVATVACDVTSEAGRTKILEACPTPDILVNNAGGPPPGDFRDWEKEEWLRAINANMLTPIFLIKETVDSMMNRGFGRIVNITSSAVKSPIPVLGLSNGARTGLTGFVAGLARETVQFNVTINNLLPGPFATDRLIEPMRAEARREGISVEEVKEIRVKHYPAKRLGIPSEFGEVGAFLCGGYAGYITGQNLVIDGGAFRGTL